MLLPMRLARQHSNKKVSEHVGLELICSIKIWIWSVERIRVFCILYSVRLNEDGFFFYLEKPENTSDILKMKIHHAQDVGRVLLI